MRRALVLCALALAVAGTTGDAQEVSFGHVTTIAMPRVQAAQHVLLEDVNGDGARDLVIVASRGGKRARRILRIHHRRAGEVAFGPTPNVEIDLLPDVVGIAVADVHADPGAEVVLLAPNGAFALRTGVADERDRYVRLADAEILWQLPQARSIVTWQDGVTDLDADGLPDLVLPEPEGYTIAMQRRAADGARTFESYELLLPNGAADAPRGRGARRLAGRAGKERVQVSLRLGEGGDTASSGLLQVTEAVPAPQAIDWDGDRRLDIAAQTVEELLVWLQRPDGAYREAPDVRIPLPLEVDRRRLLDVSYSAHVTDLDGDGRADYVLVAGDQNSDSARAQVLAFRRGPAGKETGTPLFGEKGLPSQLLVIAGIAGAPELIDVDGDGFPDLVMGAARLDALDAVRAAAGGTLDIDLYVYRNQRGVFSKRPDLTRTLSVAARGLREARTSLAAGFVGDATGDGVQELLLRDDPTRVRLLMVRKVRETLTVIDTPLWETVVAEDAELVTAGGPGESPELVLFTRGTLQHVRFGR